MGITLFERSLSLFVASLYREGLAGTTAKMYLSGVHFAQISFGGGGRSRHWEHAIPRVHLKGIPQAGSGEISPVPTHNSLYPDEDAGHMVKGTGETERIHALGSFLYVCLWLPEVGGDSIAF